LSRAVYGLYRVQGRVSIRSLGDLLNQPDPDERAGTVSFQAYLDTIEDKTGLTPRQLVEIAETRGLTGDDVKAGEILEWLKADYGLGRGHGMALVHVIKKGDQIDAKHVGTTGVHRDDSDTLWLGGKASKPA
jgi:hypothetical protein